MKKLGKIAEKLYEHDSDLSDPNQAFKAMWPSTTLWRRCVQYAVKLAPSPAEEIVAEIPDAEIRSFQRLALATALLGGDIPRLSIMEIHKDEHDIMIVH